MDQTRITLTPIQFKQLLESQVRFAHLKHDLIADCAYIDTLFPQSAADNTIRSNEGLVLNYDTMYISGGYFFKYSANNPFARILPDYFNDFLKEQKIDFYSISFPQVENDSNILNSFRPKYSVSLNQEEFTVMTGACKHNSGVTFTLNYWKDANERTPVNNFFDAEFCNVEYWIKTKQFSVSKWFDRENDTYNAELFPANINKERKLKFRMKGLYNLNDEMYIRAAARI